MRDGRILIVAGESSGDLHAAGVVAELRRRAPDLTIEGIGGERMRRAGVRLHAHAGDLAVVGLVEVAGRLPAIWRAYRSMIRCLRDRRPDLVILVDFPDFNLRLARRAFRLGIPVVYFIGPQVWAWRAGRIRAIARYVRRLLVIFPFEEGFYRDRGVEASYVGHPLMDRLACAPSMDEARRRLGLEGEAPVLGLLPGSRVGELARHLPVLLRSAKQLMAERPDLRVIIAAADGLPLDLIGSYVNQEAVSVRVVQGRTYEVVAASDLILVASGTATLEAGIIGTPMVIVYRLAFLSWLFGRLLIRVPYIGMVNLVAGKRVVPELIQFQATPERIADEARRLLQSAEQRCRTRQELRQMRDRLGPSGALSRTADAILECLRSGVLEEMVAQGG
ncbi:Lipid-A-disaccharide synthase [Candidatus Methylomirabilis lanthanidiphila]|uniref:Lipid-A-disaccharide synthase n=1 Tax=Candidatus Methylomirabilis lanthanidiphila TaxID=2211376 RepID=A0A564ZKV5_9BACT|nr:lipid-A-disaccharide synthase [Candidatus Methylomirabilis lanthanidiphila]VUZ85970.1 Lipid-A-disaccharide synthase [Candidatus Methylomirabilis lanthanidiphila]